MMGSSKAGDRANEKPLHKVTVGKALAVGKFHVTFAEWDACVAAGGCKHRPTDSWGRGRQPVIDVSWEDATREYLPWLNRRTGKTYRLLTEAEWEYSARGVTSVSAAHTVYPWGNAIGQNRANCRGCGSQWDARQPAPVGSFAANAFGLHDMHGNLWQWVQDCYKDSYADAPSNGQATSDVASCHRVLRGGSWFNGAVEVRSAERNRSEPNARSSNIGFRVARML